MKKILMAIFTIATVLTACVGEDFVEREKLFNERLTIVSLGNNSSADTLIVGDTLILEANFVNSEGNEEEVDLVWESSNPEFAVIERGNELIAIAEGITTISVTHSGITEEALLVIDRLERIELSVPNTSLQVGETLTPVARYFNEQGIATNAGINYTSSNTAVASFTNGQLLALQEGQTILTANFNGVVSNSISIAIVADTISVASVEITPSSGSIMVGETIQFNAVAKNINGTILPNAPISWNSTMPSVLSLNANGLGTGNAVGSSDVTASSGNATSDASSVLVNPMVVTTRTGNFVGIGRYRVNGTVTMSTMPNGNLKLDFAGFSSSSGPGLYIYLSNTTSNGLSIEPLNRRSGNFTVNLPASIGISDYNNVLIWCEPFGLTFGFATLN